MKPDPDSLGLGGNPMSPECMRTLKRAWVGSNGMGNRRRIEIGWSPEDDPQRAAFIASKLAEWQHAPLGSDPAPPASRRTERHT